MPCHGIEPLVEECLDVAWGIPDHVTGEVPRRPAGQAMPLIVASHHAIERLRPERLVKRRELEVPDAI